MVDDRPFDVDVWSRLFEQIEKHRIRLSFIHARQIQEVERGDLSRIGITNNFVQDEKISITMTDIPFLVVLI